MTANPPQPQQPYYPQQYGPPVPPPVVRKKGLGGCAIAAIVLAGLCALGGVVSVIQAVFDPDRESTSTAESPIRAEPITTAAGLWSQLDKTLSSSNRKGVRRVDHVALDSGVITVQWAIDDSLTENLIKAGMRRDVHKILEEVQKSSIDYTAVHLVGTFSMVDLYGNASESEVVRLGYTKTVIDKVNFANVNRDNLPQLADLENFIHREFRD